MSASVSGFVELNKIKHYNARMSREPFGKMIQRLKMLAGLATGLVSDHKEV